MMHDREAPVLPLPAKIACLVEQGLLALLQLSPDGSPPSYGRWLDALRGSFDRPRGISSEEAAWLWNALRLEPGIRRSLGCLPKAPAPRPSNVPGVIVFPAGSRFEFAVRAVARRTQEALSLFVEGPETTAAAYAVIREPLRMRPGKAAELECCPVGTDLIIRHDSPVQLSDEAMALRVSRDRVSAHADGLTVQVRSLNEAYTRASLRLEEGRMAYGGSIYDAVCWVDDGGPERPGRRILLGMVRSDVEKGYQEYLAGHTFPERLQRALEAMRRNA